MAMKTNAAPKVLPPGVYKRIVHVEKVKDWKAKGYVESKDQSEIKGRMRGDSVVMEKVVLAPAAAAEPEKKISNKEKK